MLRIKNSIQKYIVFKFTFDSNIILRIWRWIMKSLLIYIF